jgi:hypothetical protein
MVRADHTDTDHPWWEDPGLQEEKRQAGLFPSQQHLAASPEGAGDNCAD